MIALPIIVLLLILAFKFKNLFKKYSIYLYLLFLVLSTIAYIFIDKPGFTLFKMGYLSFAFFYVVMLVGALPKKQPKPKENIVRRDYSIIGFITIIPHVLYNIFNVNIVSNGPIVFGLITFISMIPLFITSFPYIRKKMKESSWIKLQKLAYLSYVTLFIHLIIHSTGANLVMYIVLFAVYIVLKIRLILKNKSLVNKA
ncbi:MAG: hypothetical protein PHZ28_04850 [Candidatus Izemoplasmatales bacterium]|nr:hypothetical protein [Candidatus Izemoplasmatales bacterium]